ncbi:MAG TPA: hypothetical protein VLK84_00615 [Longimicrobium sp.]|nr:hypothetical protein [Longimicrobium sp.]
MAVLADEANVSQEGKLNLMGIFDRIAAADFPVVHPKMVFAFRVEAEFADSGRMFPVRVSMEDEDGNALFEAAGEMMAPHVVPGEYSTANQLFALVGVQFPRAGLYRFIVQVGDTPPHETPLLVQPAPSATDPTMN